jgi:hypothetical protein
MMTQRRPAFDSMFRQKRQYGGAEAGTAGTTAGTTAAPAAAYGGSSSAATGGESGSSGGESSSSSSGGSQCKCAEQASKCPPGKDLSVGLLMRV